MLGFDAPLDTLRVKSAPGRGRKERKADSEDKSDGSGSDGAGSSMSTQPFQQMEADLAAMQELLGVKKIYCTLLLGLRVTPLSLGNVSEYSFLSGGEDEKASDLGDNNNEASS
ncbi:hypothetical protein HAX54_033405 [Datura stramonium]|uniref:Uncharacterized protein n=1 Tax=Datura stramonium TaxID=4076 RepID=A0ABS8VEV4_DATST|nr:hypothetical protein [Datura stramonium]